MIKYNVKNHEPSFLPEGKQWKLAWSDEFDGTERPLKMGLQALYDGKAPQDVAG